MNDQTSLKPDQSLHGQIDQKGILPGPEKLAVFQKALELRNTPGLYSQENHPEKQACVKFFDPCGSWSWYAVEWDRKDLCFGYVDGHFPEWGYFNIHELASVRGLLGIGIEVDEFFHPQPVPETRRSHSKEPDQGLEPGD